MENRVLTYMDGVRVMREIMHEELRRAKLDACVAEFAAWLNTEDGCIVNEETKMRRAVIIASRVVNNSSEHAYLFGKFGDLLETVY